MGRKRKQSGIVWSADPMTGTPRGEANLDWDGRSRTEKRTRARAEIDARRDLIEYLILLPVELRSTLAEEMQTTLISPQDDDEALISYLSEQLDRLNAMKRGGAKKREIKHLSARLDEREWELLFDMKRRAMERTMS